MKNFNKELFIGILILGISACSAFISESPIIWIGGFIWGASLISQSVGKRKQVSFNVGGIDKEIITCGHCKQKLRVPKDRQRYTDITCTTCHKDPFVGLLGKFKKDWRRYKTPLIASFVGIILILFYQTSNHKNPIITAPVVTPSINNSELTGIKLTKRDPIPVPVSTNIVSFSNGEFLNKNSAYLQGLGELQITNGTSNDAVAKLVSINTDKAIATVFIKANNNYTLKDISDSNYKLVFNLGHDWDTISKKFIKNSSYAKFAENFIFNTYTTENGNYIQTHYDTYEVTLNPVINGTAKTDPVNPEEFSNY